MRSIRSRGRVIVGTAAAVYYSAARPCARHYDARAHLVVARRIIDSLTPGWQQVGAVWLPLPHLLNMLPVQIDALYRTGASAIAISVAQHGARGMGACRRRFVATHGIARAAPSRRRRCCS